jgi:Transcription factor WhiB
MTRASCVGKWDLFFPERDDPDRTAKVAAAQFLCMSCPVMRECKRYELKVKPVAGVWHAKNITRTTED